MWSEVFGGEILLRGLFGIICPCGPRIVRFFDDLKSKRATFIQPDPELTIPLQSAVPTHF